ncbi:MAG: SRPBCC family protein [Sulfolobales archaeon]|nr:SRPBCC family protein [Sulfolobales archaeon]
MITETITFRVPANFDEVVQLLSDPNNLPKFWKYLTKVEVEGPGKFVGFSQPYVAHFKVFMTFRFDMRVVVMPNAVVHEGTMRFPKATFKFAVVDGGVEKSSGLTTLIVTGEYQGPLESLATKPMRSFLEHFKDSFIKALRSANERKASKASSFSPQELLELLKKDSEDSTVRAKVRVKGKDYVLVLEDGEIKEVVNVPLTDFLMELLSSTSAELIEESYVYRLSPKELLERLKEDSRTGTVRAKVKVENRMYSVVFENGDIKRVEDGSLFEFISALMAAKEVDLEELNEGELGNVTTDHTEKARDSRQLNGSNASHETSS